MYLTDEEAELFLFFMAHRDEIARIMAMGLVSAGIEQAASKSTGALTVKQYALRSGFQLAQKK